MERGGYRDMQKVCEENEETGSGGKNKRRHTMASDKKCMCRQAISGKNIWYESLNPKTQSLKTYCMGVHCEVVGEEWTWAPCRRGERQFKIAELTCRFESESKEPTRFDRRAKGRETDQDEDRKRREKKMVNEKGPSEGRISTVKGGLRGCW
jgi:hypothetical protein